MKKRPAQTKAEVDFLPPFGQPEVVVFGKAAWVMAGAVSIAALNQLGK